MNKTDLEKRQARAETEPFIITKNDDGYRISSSLTPAKQYLVTGIPDTPRCSCPDFELHQVDPEWRCKHTLAVVNHAVKQNHHADVNDAAGATANVVSPPGPIAPPERKKAAARASKSEAMLIKRSVSPDGRIDSLSVEFSCPVGNVPPDEIKQRADKALKLQTEIMGSFLKQNGKNGNNEQPQNPVSDVPGAVPAKMILIGGLNGKWGRRLFIAVQLDGRRQSKLFGSHQELADAITAAGCPTRATQIAEGVQLNVPCRVVTEPSRDGKYLNITKVLPQQAQAAVRGA
jgi:hypothetical protein